MSGPEEATAELGKMTPRARSVLLLTNGKYWNACAFPSFLIEAAGYLQNFNQALIVLAACAAVRDVTNGSGFAPDSAVLTSLGLAERYAMGESIDRAELSSASNRANYEAAYVYRDERYAIIAQSAADASHAALVHKKQYRIESAVNAVANAAEAVRPFRVAEAVRSVLRWDVIVEARASDRRFKLNA